MLLAFTEVSLNSHGLAPDQRIFAELKCRSPASADEQLLPMRPAMAAAIDNRLRSLEELVDRTSR